MAEQLVGIGIVIHKMNHNYVTEEKGMTEQDWLRRVRKWVG